MRLAHKFSATYPVGGRACARCWSRWRLPGRSCTRSRATPRRPTRRWRRGRRARRRAAPNPRAVLNGTYRLDYDRPRGPTNGTPIRHAGAASTIWWAFRSAVHHQRLRGHRHPARRRHPPGGQHNRWRPVRHPAVRRGVLAGGAARSGWAAPGERSGTRDPGGDRLLVAGAATRRHAARRGDRNRPHNECGAQGAVVRVPVVATRVGDVPRRHAGRPHPGDHRPDHTGRSLARPSSAGSAAMSTSSATTRPAMSRSCARATPGKGPDHHGRARRGHLV